jgi:transposase InsO family protein
LSKITADFVRKARLLRPISVRPKDLISVALTSVTAPHGRKVIGRALSGDMTAEHTTVPALSMACMNRKPKDGPVFHSGSGARYIAASFREKLRELCPAVRQSMNRKGNCQDNARAESFFKTLKRELETLNGRHLAAEVRQSVFMYIEAYYNRVRMPAILLLETFW